MKGKKISAPVFVGLFNIFMGLFIFGASCLWGSRDDRSFCLAISGLILAVLGWFAFRKVKWAFKLAVIADLFPLAYLLILLVLAQLRSHPNM